MAMVNIKDSRWLQVEVCREFQRNKCSRADSECKFAHPPVQVEVQSGRVIACYDSIKGRCNRENPPCKYFHPPQHLKDQLLINGRNHLALKNALIHQMPLQPVIAGQIPAVASTNHYIANLPTIASSIGPYLTPSAVLPTIMPTDAIGTPLTVVATQMVPSQRALRTDRLEVCREFQRGNCKRVEEECRFAHPSEHVTIDNTDGMVTVCMDFIKGRCTREQCRYFHPPLHLQAQLKAMQNRSNNVSMLTWEDTTRNNNKEKVYHTVVPYAKRPTMDKNGVPFYQPTNSAYHQTLAMHIQQPYVPVSYPYLPSSVTGHIANVPRY